MRALLAISVGNTRTAMAHFHDGHVHGSHRLSNQDLEAIVAAAAAEWEHLGAHEDQDATCVLASVNDAVADALEPLLAARLGTEVWRIGRDIGVPVGECLDPGARPGADRLLNAAAAFDVMKSACVVVDAGTAVTVDFVDGHGVFQGGAIAPGAAMQLRALHRETHALPQVEFRQPAEEPFGRSTEEAMLQGVYHGLRGMVWRLVERYAQAYGAFPPVIATGGDAALLFEGDELVDRIVPDLTLMGIDVAVRMAGDDADAPADEGGDGGAASGG